MLLSEPVRPIHTASTTGIVGGAEGARLLSAGALGARLVSAARLAAAIHMAQSAAPRNDAAQFLPRAGGQGGAQ